MAALNLIFIAVVASITGAWSTENASRIIGGIPALIERFPSVVQVQAYSGSENWWTFCGGTILSEIFVLSAANCFDEILHSPDIIYRGQRRIKAGTILLHEGGVNSVINRVHIHPLYTPHQDGADDDICLLRLGTPLQWTDQIRQIAIPSQGFVVPHNALTTYVGWGQLWWGGPPPNDVLHSVNVPIINHDTCQQIFGQVTVPPRKLCAGAPGMSSCQGDFGGPVYFNNMVVGIVSWGRYCDVNPALNTDVAAFSDWIVATAV